MAMTAKERKQHQRERGTSVSAQPEYDRERKWRDRGIKDITYQQYLDMLEAQRHMCAICGDHINGNSALDHDHTTGEPRGLLCNGCNLMMSERLEKNINHVQAYLQLWRPDEMWCNVHNCPMSECSDGTE